MTHERRQPHTSRRGLYAAVGIGVLALAGLIGGLVAAFGGSSPAPSSTGRPHTHVPVAHASAHPITARLLQKFQFVGPSDSSGFTVPSSSVASYYMYRCPSGPHAFDATMMNANGSDRQTIAKTIGHTGTGFVVLHPKDPGRAYHLAIRTECVYRIQVYGP